MRQVKTARGRIIDMGALAKQNEDMRAVSPGNATMNARGDHIDQKGNVVKTVQTKSHEVHNTTSGPEKRPLSEVPGTEKSKEKAAKVAKATQSEPLYTESEKENNSILSQVKKKRDDGSQYLETEYENGDIEVTEVDET